VHKGLPGIFIEEYCHTDDLARAAAAFPDLNFIAFTARFHGKPSLPATSKLPRSKTSMPSSALWREWWARIRRVTPVLIGTLLESLGADHILWGTDTPVIGPPHWQIEAFQTFTIPEQIAGQHGYRQLTPEVKNKIFGENAARIFGIDIATARQAVEGDLLYKLRDDHNPLPTGAPL
jgi:uncharacterized protein